MRAGGALGRRWSLRRGYLGKGKRLSGRGTGPAWSGRLSRRASSPSSWPSFSPGEGTRCARAVRWGGGRASGGRIWRRESACRGEGRCGACAPVARRCSPHSDLIARQGRGRGARGRCFGRRWRLWRGCLGKRLLGSGTGAPWCRSCLRGLASLPLTLTLSPAGERGRGAGRRCLGQAALPLAGILGEEKGLGAVFPGHPRQ